MKKLKKEIHLEGIPISEGIGIGTFFLSKGKQLRIPEFAVTSTQVSFEIARYRRALSASREELENLYNHLKSEGSDEVCGIIDTHIQMLQDPVISTSIEEKISRLHQNTESVFIYAIDEYITMFKKHMKPELAAERLLDIKDLSHRILRHLNPSITEDRNQIFSHCIYADYEINPTKVAEAQKGFIEGFISKIGGQMSHSALIARAKGIPFVSGINLSILEDLGRENVIIDGYSGLVIIHPSHETMEKYYQKNKLEPKIYFSSEEKIDYGKSKDGEKITVAANFDCMDDLKKISEYGIDSVGLIRTEFLFLQEAITTLSLEFQISRYEQIIEGANNAELTFRLFDIGSDKKIIEMKELEPNPALGCRSIRFLMKYPKIFSIQVKALYAASLKGNIRILLPLITDYDELLVALSFIENARKEISKEIGVKISKVSIGCMVEVPSFVLLADHFAKVCDFFSIGTNDLMQYTLAMDRISPNSETIFQLYHPSILQLIHKVVKAANNQGIEVSICGEAASCEYYTELLVGLGIRNFSCSMRYVSKIRKKLREIDTKDAEILGKKALLLPSIEDVRQLIYEDKGALV